MATILFGGSFNPVHLGHLAMAKAALEYLPHATLIWIPAACSPFKVNQTLASEHHRYEMCKLLAQEDTRMVVSDLEFFMEKPSYTIHTVQHFTSMQSDEYYFLCGADAFLSLFQWKNIEQLAKMVTFLVANREETPWELLDQQKRRIREIGGNAVFLKMSDYPVSSTVLRKELKAISSQHQFLHPKVLRYIQENNLYRE